MSPFDADLRLAIAAARHAGAATLRHFGTRLTVEMKAPDQPLTVADLEADALLHEELSGARPEYGWLSEESVDGPDRLERERVWIIDPIDGTRSFIAGRPEYAVSIGLAQAGKAVVGVVFNPARDELFYATRGGGAWLEQGRAAPVRLHAGDEGGRRVLFASRSEIGAGEFELLAPDWRIEPQGSTAYKLALVGAGRGDAFLSRGPKSEWDVCAGSLIVAESGGRVTDLSGIDLVYNRPDPHVHGILAAPSVLHAALLVRAAALPPTDRMLEVQRARQTEERGD